MMQDEGQLKNTSPEE